MKVRNSSEKFNITYNNIEYEIPTGEMEISDDAFGTFLINKARRWGFSVVKTDATPRQVVEAIKPIVEVVEEAPIEATKEDEPVAKTATTEEIKETKRKK